LTVASVAGADEIWEINASCQVGSVNKGTYIVSFTAWTDSGSYALSPGLQESGGAYTTFTTFNSSNISLTTTPTQYSVVADVSIAGNAQATFGCAQQTGTFHIKGVSVSAAPASTLSTPSISGISYDSTTAKTTVTFPGISGAEYVYLYESTEDAPTTATLLCAANQSQGFWQDKTKKEIGPTTTGSTVTGFTVTGYSATGTYYYWISGQKDKESESAKSPAASVSISGSFSNYASIPTNADCRSLNDNWSYTISSTGTDTPQFFYAASGMPITISGNSSDSAKVGIIVYLAAATPSTYVIGGSNSYDFSWQTTTGKSFTTTAPGYYVIERYNSTTGSYGLDISTGTAAKNIIAPSASRSAGTEGKILMLNRR
jgi:hypothetical protein